MRKWAFILFVLGMVVMLVLFLLPGKEVESLDGLEINSKVVVTGRVISERAIYSGTRLLELDNGLEAVCECDEQFDGRDVRIEGVVSEYNGAKQVTVERVWVLS